MQAIRDVAFDSNVLTFFLYANRGQYELVAGDPLREERIAAYRLFLFCNPLIVTTVFAEAEQITDAAMWQEHLKFIRYHFNESAPDEMLLNAIERRAVELERFHSGEMNDCKILAEVEARGVLVLVTFDKRFQKRLGGQTAVRILTPSECWQWLAIPRGTPPLWPPASGHPLASEDWWQW